MQRIQTNTLPVGQTLGLHSSRMAMSKGKGHSRWNTVDKGLEAGKWKTISRNSVQSTFTNTYLGHTRCREPKPLSDISLALAELRIQGIQG